MRSLKHILSPRKESIRNLSDLAHETKKLSSPSMDVVYDLNKECLIIKDFVISAPPLAYEVGLQLKDKDKDIALLLCKMEVKDYKRKNLEQGIDTTFSKIKETGVEIKKVEGNLNEYVTKAQNEGVYIGQVKDEYSTILDYSLRPLWPPNWYKADEKGEKEDPFANAGMGIMGWAIIASSLIGIYCLLK